MTDKIINIAGYLAGRDGPPGPPDGSLIALWGAEGERSRFALPIWRIVRLAEGDRGALVWRRATDSGDPRPLLVLDMAQEPARTAVASAALEARDPGEQATLYDRPDEGRLAIYLGKKDERAWWLVVDGRARVSEPLDAKSREDVLFLAGECAGLLFLRDFADLLDDED